ncbi:NYN domain-containing protein [Staphylococcus simulans]|uniref:NYN domain-containing protein n=1 Tax=Staphylococcus simulans TaxID=1286 RepID=UPI000D1D1D0F|nr:NYN domain-containing protein [Staphylococcus simulans]PTJ22367.1 hypothetical protein BU039_08315 [Staphylococcus simulans]
MKHKDRYLIIDGYNMIGHSRALSELAKENLEEAREKLLLAIGNYKATVADDVICVFDAYEQEGNESEFYYHGVRTIFTKEHETADSFIERFVYGLYDKHTTHIAVVTSDMSEQHAIFGTGAYRISSREMWQNIKLNEASVESSMKTFNNNKPRTRIQLTDEVLSEFEKFRRGDQEK